MKFEDGRIGMEVIKGDEKGVIYMIGLSWGAGLFGVCFQVSPDTDYTHLTWVKAADCEPLEYVEPLKFQPGEKGWVPDQMAEGIDIMNITEELVAVEVGK